jgi:hypothetical protein
MNAPSQQLTGEMVMFREQPRQRPRGLASVFRLGLKVSVEDEFATLGKSIQIKRFEVWDDFRHGCDKKLG